MKENKPKGILSFITGGGTYKEAEVRGRRRAGRRVLPEPGLRPRARRPARAQGRSRTPRTARRAGSQLRIPVTEGPRYRVGELRPSTATPSSRAEALRPLFKVETGRVVQTRRRSTTGCKKAQEIYGARRLHGVHRLPGPASTATTRRRRRAGSLVPEALAARRRATGAASRRSSTSRCGSQEGQQYFVNRITFTGNTTTRDNVIRREMRLVEGGVFNTEALKYSVRRLNQLGYFKELEGQRQGHEGGQDARPGRTPSTSR